MNLETEDLMTIKNYATKMGVSTTTVYNWSLQGKVKLIEIDGVKFIKTK